jgi:SAM-dependent methyltransferase
MTMTDSYAVLAGIYKAVGLNSESEVLRERLFNKIQSDGWLGRRVLELGCGAGDTACWFSTTGFRISAVDQSESMLSVARQQAEAMGVTVNWFHQDIRHLDVGNDFDMVMCMNTLNEIRSIRDIEMVFRAANQALSMNQQLVFDLVTVQGLAEHWGNRDFVLYDNSESLMLTVRSRYSFETSVNTRAYTVFRQSDGQWVREDETHVLRGYSLQAVSTLLQRTGFRIQSVMDPYFASFDPNADQSGRAIVIATKAKELA